MCLWCVALCCVPVANLATCVLPFVLCGLLPHSRSKFLSGFRDRSAPKESWQTPLRLMAAKNGYVSSVPKPVCGPGGVADDVTPTSQPVCRRSTNKQSSRRAKGGLQDPLPRVVVKRRSSQMRKKRSRSCVLRKQQRVEKEPDTQGEPARRGSGLEERMQDGG